MSFDRSIHHNLIKPGWCFLAGISIDRDVYIWAVSVPIYLHHSSQSKTIQKLLNSARFTSQAMNPAYVTDKSGHHIQLYLIESYITVGDRVERVGVVVRCCCWWCLPTYTGAKSATVNVSSVPGPPSAARIPTPPPPDPPPPSIHTQA